MASDAIEKLRANCLATYGGGYHDGREREIFQHGMETVCNVLRDSRFGGVVPKSAQDHADRALLATMAATIAAPILFEVLTAARTEKVHEEQIREARNDVCRAAVTTARAILAEIDADKEQP